MKYDITIVPEGWEKPLIFMLAVLSLILMFKNQTLMIDEEVLTPICEQLLLTDG